MILLDTNIISEMMKSKPAQAVISWLNQQKSTQLFISTVSVAEISYGLHALPERFWRAQLENAFNQAIELSFKHRILSFDSAAAYRYGKIMADRKALGRPLSLLDGQIAAIAHTQGFLLVTRNVRDCLDCGVNIFNPFDA